MTDHDPRCPADGAPTATVCVCAGLRDPAGVANWVAASIKGNFEFYRDVDAMRSITPPSPAMYQGTTPPTSPKTGDLWMHPGRGTIFMYSENSWKNLAPSA